FDDDEAVYPVTVDPLIWTQEAELLANDGAANDEFGYSVALSGNTALVSAYQKTASQGAAYVFVRSGASWSLQQELTGSDSAADDLLGNSVALSGDTAVVGAAAKVSAQGAAYVFVRSGASWSQQAELTVANGAADDEFGCSVA